MIEIKVDDRAVRRLLQQMPKTARSAAEYALDQTATAIYRELKAELGRVFDRPVPYTRNSLKVTRTKNHNMHASVWFKDPERMAKHYLVPEVEGGEREYKGFERALGRKKFIPSKSMKLDRYGNIGAGLLRQLLGVLGKAEMTAGYQANVTAKSAKRNRKDRDYVYLPRGSKRGALPPGIYRRVVTGNSLTAKQRRQVTSFGNYEQGKRNIGVLLGNGKFRVEQNIVHARGLQPVILLGRQHGKYKPLLHFYLIADQVYARQFLATFSIRFSSLVGK